MNNLKGANLLRDVDGFETGRLQYPIAIVLEQEEQTQEFLPYDHLVCNYKKNIIYQLINLKKINYRHHRKENLLYAFKVTCLRYIAN